jgi:ComF family protein
LRPLPQRGRARRAIAIVSDLSLSTRCLHFLLPDPCLACARPRGDTPVGLGLCPACAARLVRARGARCRTCGRLLPAADAPDALCGACATAPRAFERLVAGWLYQPPFDSVVRALKFGRLEALGARLATALCREVGPALAGFDLVVPVPLHWRRRLTRGFDQAERIAEPLAALLDVRCVTALRRRSATARQTRLSRRARLGNLRRAFVVRRTPELLGRRILLVDDVATTGSTLDAAAGVLRRAGAGPIWALAAGLTEPAVSRVGASPRPLRTV